jgi:hypothetical protein
MALKTKQVLTYLCYVCGTRSDGLLCGRCRREIDAGEFGRVVKLVTPGTGPGEEKAGP